ncbi:MAG TPA: hypothetical protein VJZ26_00450 [Blastocatellia bacterium]|nr:hypothetical protein [Blastocatellia bacterium]
MSRDDFEQRFQHHVEFMLEQQARSDERLTKLEETQLQQTENINLLVGAVNATQSQVDSISKQVDSLAQQVDSIINEMRDGFNNLIVANEVSRHLAEEATRLTIQTSQRVTGLERRVTDLEQK